MICIGYDYGTTNSIVTQYVGTTEAPVKVLKKRTSSIQDGPTHVRSPKRLLSAVPMDEYRATRYLYEFSSDILQQALLSAPKTDPVFITASVPNAYKDHQCKLMLDTIRLVGERLFSEVQFNRNAIAIIPEPIAAALYYVMLEAGNIRPKGIVCICDIGGGTTDLAIVKYSISGEEEHKHISFNVLCTAPGDDTLGGDDIDAAIASEICGRYELNISKYSEQTLNAACRALKRQLSVRESATVVLTGPDGVHPAKDESGNPIELLLTRKLLNALLEKHFIPRLVTQLEMLKESFVSYVKSKDAGRGTRENAEYTLSQGIILPIGGTSQIPRLQEIMREHLKGELFFLPGERIDRTGMAPYDSVARGAAIYSAWLNQELTGIDSIILEGRTMHTISLEVNQGELETLVERNMPSAAYRPSRQLFPLMAESDGKSFRIKRIDFYEGEGCFVGDTRFGPAPQHLRSLAERLENLNDLIYTHGRALPDIPIDVQLLINGQGRLASLTVTIPQGRADHSDYCLHIDFIK